MQHLSRAELLALLAAAKAHRERDWLMILTAYWHGLRVSEVTGFRPEAVRDGYITIQRLKGSLKTIQPLVEHPDPLLNERQPLEALVAESVPDLPVFRLSRQRAWRLMRRYCRLAGIPAHKAHPHVLKHSIAAHSIRDAGIDNVRQHLGHKSLASTGAYLRVTDQEASAAIQRAARGGKQ